MTTGRAERWIWIGLGAVLLTVIVAGLWSLPGAFDRHSQPENAPLPALGLVPAFALTERSGRTVSAAELAGQPWVADFIFTRCAGICPVLSARMAELQRSLQSEGLTARLVSFSVDPNRDTPEILREYAGRYRADADQWWFLTGERDTLYRLIGEGFHLNVAERSAEEAQGSGELITHSDRFVLVDGALQIRGYYHGTEPETVAKLLHDLATLTDGPSRNEVTRTE